MRCNVSFAKSKRKPPHARMPSFTRRGGACGRCSTKLSVNATARSSASRNSCASRLRNRPHPSPRPDFTPYFFPQLLTSSMKPCYKIAALLCLVGGIALAESQKGGKAEAIFQRADKNGDGKITPDELPNAETFATFDLNKDGI